MLDRQLHERILKNLLKDVYTHPQLSQSLVFKGGTACYLFYDLPRFSVDLDFNLRSSANSDLKVLIIKEIKKLAENYGRVEDFREKKNTLFVLLRYKAQNHPIKIEINTRQLTSQYQLLNFFGTGVAVLPKEIIFAEKLMALTHRRATANRDIFDLNFFFKEGWLLDKNYLENLVDEDWEKYLKKCIKFLEKRVDRRTILDGLGQLIVKEQRSWVRQNLVMDTLFQLKSYLQTEKKQT